MNPHLKQFEFYVPAIEEELIKALKQNILPPFVVMVFELNKLPEIFKVEERKDIPSQVRECKAESVALIYRSFFTVNSGEEEFPGIFVAYKDKTLHSFIRIYPVEITDDDIIMNGNYIQRDHHHHDILDLLFVRLH
jgi:hypothetical protein